MDDDGNAGYVENNIFFKFKHKEPSIRGCLLRSAKYDWANRSNRDRYDSYDISEGARYGGDAKAKASFWRVEN